MAKLAEAAATGQRRLGASETRLWAVLIVGAAYWANIVRGTGAQAGLTLAGVVNGVLDNGAFDVFAWALLLARCLAPWDRRPASPRAIVVAITVGVIVLAPVRLAPALALALLGLLLFADRLLPSAVRQMRLVLFALAFETLWITSPLAPLHVLMGSVDAQVAALLLRASGQTVVQHGNVVENLSTHFNIVIWPYCSSTFPLADVGLAFLVMVLYRGRAVRLAHLPWLAVSFAGSMLLTEIRLALMTGGEAAYQWWHFGTGVSVYGLAALGLAVAVPILATQNPAAPGPGAVARPAA